MSPLDLGDAEGHHHAVGVMRGLLINGIDEIERVLREVALIRFRFNPYGKELRAQISGTGFIQADVAGIFRVGVANVVVVVEKTLGRIRVRVYHNGGVLDLPRARADVRAIGYTGLRDS